MLGVFCRVLTYHFVWPGVGHRAIGYEGVLNRGACDDAVGGTTHVSTGTAELRACGVCSEAEHPSAHERLGCQFPLRLLDAKAQASSRSEQRGA